MKSSLRISMFWPETFDKLRVKFDRICDHRRKNLQALQFEFHSRAEWTTFCEKKVRCFSSSQNYIFHFLSKVRLCDLKIKSMAESARCSEKWFNLLHKTLIDCCCLTFVIFPPICIGLSSVFWDAISSIVYVMYLVEAKNRVYR